MVEKGPVVPNELIVITRVDPLTKRLEKFIKIWFLHAWSLKFSSVIRKRLGQWLKKRSITLGLVLKSSLLELLLGPYEHYLSFVKNRLTKHSRYQHVENHYLEKRFRFLFSHNCAVRNVSSFSRKTEMSNYSLLKKKMSWLATRPPVILAIKSKNAATYSISTSKVV